MDAPAAPEGGGASSGFVIAPVFSLVGPGGERPMTAGQADALAAAFARVDRFRMVVKRAADQVVVLDTVIAVTRGKDEYDLSVPIAAKENEQFLVTLTALDGETELFTAANIPAVAQPVGVAGSPPPAPVQIPLVYTGPGATATSVGVAPTQVVLSPGGAATVGAAVKDASGRVIDRVPLSWATSAPGVATVSSAGAVTAVGEGVATITATSPTNLAASATVLVATGELAYVEGGVLKVRGVAGGTASERATGGATQPAWSADGARLYYVAGGQVWRTGGLQLAAGSWPSVSPDGTKLAVERGSQVWFLNDDGSAATQGPSGTSPVWADASMLLVGGGSVQRVKADGTGRTTVVAGPAVWPALAGDGRIASVAGGEVRVTGRSGALVTGATGRPSWSPNGRWLVVGTASGLMLVPSDGSAAAAALPGLAGASDPAFKPTGALASPPSVRVTGFSPDPPIPGAQVQVLGGGFDWIIRANNHVFWPTRDGVVESDVGAVTEGSITTTMPRNVSAGTVRVQTRSNSGTLAFVPTVGTLEVTARTPWGSALAGVRVALSGPGGTVSGVTDASGALVLPGLIPGSYTATLTAPTGWELAGPGSRTLSITAETFALALELSPLIASVTLNPASPSLVVGSSLAVSLVIRGVDGTLVPQVQGLSWKSGSAELTVTPGAGLGATLGAVFAGEGTGSSKFEASFGGKSYAFGATLTSSISGVVTKETGVTPPPPAADITVQLKKAGTVVAEVKTGADGRYSATGLFRGTYDVAPLGSADLLPVPAGQSVILDAANPSGKADFKMQSFGGLDVTAKTPWDAPVAGVGVALLNAAGAELAKGTTSGLGTLSLSRLAAGSYTLKITVPPGFTLTGEASRAFILSPGVQTLALKLNPLIQSIVTIPDVLSVEVGSALAVEIIPKDINGNVIPQVQGGGWTALSNYLAAGGIGLKGQIGGLLPSAPGEARFGVELNGRLLTIGATVTSHVQGTITKSTPSGSVPAAGVLVVAEKDGKKVAEAGTQGNGSYSITGLVAGTYTVKPIAPAGLTSSPASSSVTLSTSTPTPTANFTLSAAGGRPTEGILIYGPTLYAAGGYWTEKSVAEAAGFKVTVVNAATWSSMTLADFAKYNAIVFGDNVCSSSLSILATAQSNQAVWAPAVTGNVVYNITDPVYHQRPDGAELTRASIAYAAAGNSTGLFLSLSCYYYSYSSKVTVPILAPFGTFEVIGQGGCPGDVDIVKAGHMSLGSATEAGLSNWGCGPHGFFETFPSTLEVIANAVRPSDGRRLPWMLAGAVGGPASSPEQIGQFRTRVEAWLTRNADLVTGRHDHSTPPNQSPPGRAGGMSPIR